MIISEAIATYGTDILDYLDRQAEVPVIDHAGIQGDISFLRCNLPAATTPIPKAGTVVATGNGGHDHRLLGGGHFDFAGRPGEAGMLIGTLTVPAGTEVVIAHDEHGFLAFTPGTYRVGRQREMADVIRQVED